MSQKRIMCVGLMCVDLIQVCKEYPKEDSDQRSQAHRWQRGGNASNNCTVLAKCGYPCEFLGTISDDMMAKYAKQDFEKHKIIIKNVVHYSHFATPFSSVIINSENGSRTIIHSNKNMPELTLDDFKKLDLEQYCWIHFEGRNVNEVAAMLKYILDWNTKHFPVKTSVELEKPKAELKALLPLADVVFIGKDFASFQGCKNKYEALKMNSSPVKPRAMIVVAWGESGAVGQTADGDLVESSAFPARTVVDTLGAGDTFVAATLLSLSTGQDLKNSITMGCRVAGTKVSDIGYNAIHPGLLKMHSSPFS